MHMPMERTVPSDMNRHFCQALPLAVVDLQGRGPSLPPVAHDVDAAAGGVAVDHVAGDGGGGRQEPEEGVAVLLGLVLRARGRSVLLVVGFLARSTSWRRSTLSSPTNQAARGRRGLPGPPFVAERIAGPATCSGRRPPEATGWRGGGGGAEGTRIWRFPERSPSTLPGVATAAVTTGAAAAVTVADARKGTGYQRGRNPLWRLGDRAPWGGRRPGVWLKAAVAVRPGRSVSSAGADGG